MSGKIPGREAPKRSSGFVFRGVESTNRNSETGQKSAEKTALEKKIKKKLDNIAADSTTLPPNANIDNYGKYGLKMPDWAKRPRPTMAQILPYKNDTTSLPSTEEEWTKLEEDFQQREFEVFGRRAQ